jgi:hypothetical protein
VQQGVDLFAKHLFSWREAEQYTSNSNEGQSVGCGNVSEQCDERRPATNSPNLFSRIDTLNLSDVLHLQICSSIHSDLADRSHRQLLRISRSRLAKNSWLVSVSWNESVGVKRSQFGSNMNIRRAIFLDVLQLYTASRHTIICRTISHATSCHVISNNRAISYIMTCHECFVAPLTSTVHGILNATNNKATSYAYDHRNRNRITPEFIHSSSNALATIMRPSVVRCNAVYLRVCNVYGITSLFNQTRVRAWISFRAIFAVSEQCSLPIASMLKHSTPPQATPVLSAVRQKHLQPLKKFHDKAD